MICPLNTVALIAIGLGGKEENGKKETSMMTFGTPKTSTWSVIRAHNMDNTKARTVPYQNSPLSL